MILTWVMRYGKGLTKVAYILAMLASKLRDRKAEYGQTLVFIQGGNVRYSCCPGTLFPGKQR